MKNKLELIMGSISAVFFTGCIYQMFMEIEVDKLVTLICALCAVINFAWTVIFLKKFWKD